MLFLLRFKNKILGKFQPDYDDRSLYKKYGL
ncbi:hypothetical protein GFO_2946 [Christiangramia forsetii KT0803]|uniref:Uncharacterized protein n=1 Tax=Christiangramia forsetii (strain DSM 17595 / CGMCC 1.15422 / KT0803) TaxID=411154 RepID=A0M5J8_CHRFK|nr:hypothetical protein GFO_2946 [Christiangramia forsetii KT0803]